MSNDEQQSQQPETQEPQEQDANQAPARRAESPAESGAQPQATHHSKPQQHNPNVRLRELLSIPERLRTDAQWDEIIDIEISIGPRKSPTNLRPQHQPSFRQNDNRGDRPEKKHGGGNSGTPAGNKHMRKRNNKNAGGGQQGGRPSQGGGSGGSGGSGGGGQGGRSGGE